jgi:hypothetical protein
MVLAKDLWQAVLIPLQDFPDLDKNTQIGRFGLFFGLQLATPEFMRPSFYPLRNCWRVRVPASESETGKRVTKYFETQEAAQDFIAEHRKTGSIQLAELSGQCEAYARFSGEMERKLISVGQIAAPIFQSLISAHNISQRVLI